MSSVTGKEQLCVRNNLEATQGEEFSEESTVNSAKVVFQCHVQLRALFVHCGDPHNWFIIVFSCAQ
jgi:hypothetical protein